MSILIVAAALIAADGSSAALAQANEKVNPDVTATEAYWTAERLRNARPLPIPVAPMSQAAVPGPALFPESASHTSAPDAPPSVKVDGALQIQLYDPKAEAPREAHDASALQPLAFAGAGAAFTNSRVFPAAAVRAHPYRTIGKLFFFDGIGESTCSGTVIERRLVLTAAHCVYDPIEDSYFTDFTFVPAFDRGQGPFGRWNWQRVWVTRAWLNGDGIPPNRADFAIIQVADRTVGGERVSIGDVVGRLGWETAAPPDHHLTSLGYPFNLDDGERLQQTHAQVFGVLVPKAFVFGSYHWFGASGGPVVVDFGQRAQGQLSGGPRIIGVNSFADPDDWLMGASILNGQFVEILSRACARHPRNCNQKVS